jgi:hypothetical protein
MYGHIAETVRSLLPMMELLGIASAEEVTVESLAERLKMCDTSLDGSMHA